MTEPEGPEAAPPTGDDGSWPVPVDASSTASAADQDGAAPRAGDVDRPIEMPWPSSVTEAPHVAQPLEDRGWSVVATDGAEAAPVAETPVGVPPPPAARPAPRRHSRNPVDRLTRGLPDWLRVTIDWAVTIVGAVAVVLIVKAYVINPYRIPSASMEPTLHCARPETGCEARFSDRVLANRFIYRLRDPRRGEIVVFEVPEAAELRCGQGGTFVKRVVGLPGETIEVRVQGGEGFVYINGERLEEPYVRADRRSPATKVDRVKIGPDQFYMMGDNRGSSCDSRIWGTVPGDNLIGKVFATYWPPNRIGLD